MSRRRFTLGHYHLAPIAREQMKWLITHTSSDGVEDTGRLVPVLLPDYAYQLIWSDYS